MILSIGLMNFCKACVNFDNSSWFFSPFNNSFISLAKFGATCKALPFRLCSPDFRLFKSLFVRFASFLSIKALCSSSISAFENKLFGLCSVVVFSLLLVFLSFNSLSIIGWFG